MPPHSYVQYPEQLISILASNQGIVKHVSLDHPMDSRLAFFLMDDSKFKFNSKISAQPEGNSCKRYNLTSRQAINIVIVEASQLFQN